MLELDSITAGYDRRAPVFRDVSLTVAPGEAVGLLGPSGCGKSTPARVAALLHRPESGRVVLDGESVRGWRHRAPRRQRTAVGVVFQQPRTAADPRLRLRDLIAEPLRANGRRGEAAGARVAGPAVAVGLTDDLLARRPHEVSDGQLQRACLARALAPRPRWLVCDEMTATHRRIDDRGAGHGRRAVPRRHRRRSARRRPRPHPSGALVRPHGRLDRRTRVPRLTGGRRRPRAG